MKRDLDHWSLVVVGKWNTAILSPDWLAKEVFKQREVQIMYPVLGGGPPIFEAVDIRVIVSRDRVALSPRKDDEKLLSHIESASRHILNTLPHTPISAFGENFYYTVQGPPKQLSEVFGFPDAECLSQQGTITEMSLRRTIDLKSCKLNLTIASGEPFRIELNYHYEVDEAPQAAQAMENTFVRNRDYGLKLLKAVYDLTLDEDTSNDKKSE
jgi:hypothetical protein